MTFPRENGMWRWGPTTRQLTGRAGRCHARRGRSRPLSSSSHGQTRPGNYMANNETDMLSEAAPFILPTPDGSDGPHRMRRLPSHGAARHPENGTPALGINLAGCTYNSVHYNVAFYLSRLPWGPLTIYLLRKSPMGMSWAYHFS